jgi:hypothetical protein
MLGSVNEALSWKGGMNCPTNLPSEEAESVACHKNKWSEFLRPTGWQKNLLFMRCPCIYLGKVAEV